MFRNLGLNQTEIFGNTNFDTFKLAIGVPCPHIYMFTTNR
jgi:hypothetical protein